MQKEAKLPPQVIKILLGSVIGGSLGAAHGRYVSPNVLDYKDITAARNSSTLLDALTGAGLGALAGGGQLRAGKLTPAGINKGLAWYAGTQAAPVIQATMAENRDASRASADAARATADASRALADSAKVTSIPYNLERFATSGLGKGIGGGAAAAGIGGLLTGLMRRRTMEEEAKQKTRGGMVTTDILKYLLPAMAAGGLAGSAMTKNPGQSPA